MKKIEASRVGFVLGSVWIIMGFAYDNSGILILGLIVLSIGLWMQFKSKKKPEFKR